MFLLNSTFCNLFTHFNKIRLFMLSHQNRRHAFHFIFLIFFSNFMCSYSQILSFMIAHHHHKGQCQKKKINNNKKPHFWLSPAAKGLLQLYTMKRLIRFQNFWLRIGEALYSQDPRPQVPLSHSLLWLKPFKVMGLNTTGEKLIVPEDGKCIMFLIMCSRKGLPFADSLYICLCLFPPLQQGHL